mmetsp:Transcript_18068/g.72358  ORF Transcript_18068/g.72358 Transcript_18068/m.72358 type:complete len:437 (-) Transcript_18068:29-1339(-)
MGWLEEVGERAKSKKTVSHVTASREFRGAGVGVAGSRLLKNRDSLRGLVHAPGILPEGLGGGNDLGAAVRRIGEGDAAAVAREDVEEVEIGERLDRVGVHAEVPRELRRRAETIPAGRVREVIAREQRAVPARKRWVGEEGEVAARVARDEEQLQPRPGCVELPRPVALELDFDVARVDVGPLPRPADLELVQDALHVGEPLLPLGVVRDVVLVREQHVFRRAEPRFDRLRERRVVPRRVDEDAALGSSVVVVSGQREDVRRRAERLGRVEARVVHVGHSLGVDRDGERVARGLGLAPGRRPLRPDRAHRTRGCGFQRARPIVRAVVRLRLDVRFAARRVEDVARHPPTRVAVDARLVDEERARHVGLETPLPGSVLLGFRRRRRRGQRRDYYHGRAVSHHRRDDHREGRDGHRRRGDHACVRGVRAPRRRELWLC